MLGTIIGAITGFIVGGLFGFLVCAIIVASEDDREGRK